MTLIKSISGIRGTIGGMPDEGLTPLDIVKFTSAFGAWIKKRANKNKVSIVIGRDARISGEMVQHLVVGTLQGLGINVIDLGLSTTPTVEVAVAMENASGGIILTASHNPKQWNALKLLNEKGEFISAADGEEVLRMAAANEFEYANVDELGSYSVDHTYLDKHIQAVLDLPLVDVVAIKTKNFTVAIDCVNSTGGIFLPPLLKALGVKEVIELYCEPNGIFPHNPEPLPENLTEIASIMKKQKADVGFVVDPDVDRLAIVSEDGEMFGEEYTLVAVADYVLQNQKGNTVSNLSSTKALRDVTEKQGGKYFASAVGEVNVVDMMKKENAIIGGEGNGGIIYPELHYGRDALVGIALFLTHLAKSNVTCSELRNSYPNYVMSKNKIELTPDINVDELLVQLQKKYSDKEINTIDGVKIHFDNGWVHLRKSNTEPIIRIYAENTTKAKADELAQQIINDVEGMVRLV
ncbi:MAG: phosphoglucosamine mutase [Bacteroidetes bacterium HGW-Bacteroidetes-12]|nr:MAG: phosphoglucosamine mutase [Bacteroidetes bacterium HGW-Bacteroidetes-12]